MKEGNRRRVGRNSPANGTVFKRSSLGGDNPASPSGPEAIEHLRRNSLAADGVTKNTRQLSAQVDNQQEHASPTPTPQQLQIDQMPGMKMP